MEKLLKSELKVRAIRLGIKNGYHGRVISKMRKKDFIDFINESDCIDLTCDDDIPSVNQLKKELQETKKKVMKYNKMLLIVNVKYVEML